MNLIINNPYRVIGILAGTSLREQTKKIRKIAQYIEADECIEDDYTFPVLGEIERNIEIINKAASDLNTDSDKLTAALFWFYNGNDITDEPAFDALKDGKDDLAKEIWSSAISNKNLNNKNYSAFFNLSTLLLSKSVNNSTINQSNIRKGIKYKLMTLESKYIHDFKGKIIGNSYKISEKELQMLFINELEKSIEHCKDYSKHIISIINDHNFISKKDYLNKISNKHIDRLNSKIKETKTKRKNDVNNSITYAEELINETASILQEIKLLINENDIIYTSIIDKLASEILQCSIDYYNQFSEDYDADISLALNMCYKSLSIARGSVVKDRINNTIDTIKNYLEDLDNRKKYSKVKKEIESIYKQLDDFQSSDDSLSTALNFAKMCKIDLDKIKVACGEYDDLYINISTSVVMNTQGMVVSVLNKEIKARESYINYVNKIKEICYINSIRNYNALDEQMKVNKTYTIKGVEVTKADVYPISVLKTYVADAWKIIAFISKFKISSEASDRFEKNKLSLKSLYSELDEDIRFYGDSAYDYTVLRVFIGIAIILLVIIIASLSK